MTYFDGVLVGCGLMCAFGGAGMAKAGKVIAVLALLWPVLESFFHYLGWS